VNLKHRAYLNEGSFLRRCPAISIATQAVEPAALPLLQAIGIFVRKTANRMTGASACSIRDSIS